MGILSRSLKSFSEKRWHPAKWPRGGNLERWLITGETGSSHTGRDVDAESAMSNTAVWSAVTQLSQSIASLPLSLYRRSNKGKEKATNHRNFNLLHLKPNPFMGAMSFRESQVGQILRYGTCYAEKELDQSGNVVWLWPLLSHAVKVDILDNDIVYIVTLPNGKEKPLDKSRILRVNGFSSNGLIGYSPIEFCKESIALSQAIEEYGSRFFGNGARPAAVLEHPAELSQPAQDRLRKNWNEIHQGLENSHRLAILEEGMKLHEFTTNPENAQTLQTRVFQISEIARIFNMPVHMLKELTDSTNNNIEHQGLEFVINTLRPWLVKFEQEYTIQLLSEKEQKKYFYEHTIDGLLRGDVEKRHKAYSVGRQWGYYSANDVRALENLNPIGEQGDVYLNPMNMVPADRINDFIDLQKSKIDNKLKPKSDDKDEDEDKDNEEKSEYKLRYTNKKQILNLHFIRKRIQDSYVRILNESINTILNRESLAIQRAFKKHTKDVFSDWISSFFNDHQTYIRKIISPIVLSFSEQMAHQAYDEIFVDTSERDLNLQAIVKTIIDRCIEKHINRSSEFFTNIFSESNDIQSSIEKYIGKRCEKDSIDLSILISNTICNYIFSRNDQGCILRLVSETPCEFCSDKDCTSVNDSEIDKYCCCIVTS